MGLKIREAKGLQKDYPIAGIHLARLIGLVDLGHQPGYEYRGNKIDSCWKIEFTYELVNSKMKDGRPHWVSEDIKSNNYEKNGKMSNMMARVRSLDPLNESQDGTELNTLLGKPCMVTVTLNDEGYPKVQGQMAVSGIPADMPVPPLENEIFTFDMDEPNLAVWENFPDFKKEKIKQALNFDESNLSKALVEDIPF